MEFITVRNTLCFLCLCEIKLNSNYGTYENSHKVTKNTEMNENEVGKNIIDTAIAIHRELGPGIYYS